MNKKPLLLNQKLGKRNFLGNKVDRDFKNNAEIAFGDGIDKRQIKKRILIFTEFDDSEINNIGPYLVASGIDYVRVNAENFFTDNTFTIDYPENSDIRIHLKTKFQTVDLADFDYIWFRHFSANTFFSMNSEKFDKVTQLYIKQQWQIIINTIGLLFENKMVVPVNANYYISKPIQLKLARNVGFKIPDSLITNDLEEIQKHFQDKKIFAKALFHHSVEAEPGILTDFYGRTFNNSDSLINEDIKSAPTIFQEGLNNKNVAEYRVSIFGDSLVAMKYLNVSEDDWHNEDITGIHLEPIEIPKQVEDKIRLFMDKSNLLIGTIDLLYSQHDWYFLEVNPAGDWRWIEAVTDYSFAPLVVNMFLK